MNIPADIEIILHRGEEGFASLQAEWNPLLGASGSRTIFLSWEWLDSWWKCYGGKGEPFLLAARRGKNLVGIAPLYRKPVSRFGSRTGMGLFFIGDGSGDSDYLDFIIRRGDELIVMEQFVKTLLEKRDDWDLLFLNELPEGSPTLPAMASLAEQHKFHQEISRVSCPYLEFPGDWEAYLKSLRPRMRTKIRSVMKGFGVGTEQVVFDRLSDPSQISGRLESLFDLHGRRWQRKGQSGVFLLPGKQDFYKEITRRFLWNNWLRFYSVSVNGEYVAHQFCFEFDDIVFLLQEGYNPDYEEREVGNYLRALVFKECIERGVKTYDFLGGTSFHKSSWGGKEKQNLRWTLGHPSLLNGLHFSLAKSMDRGKQLAKEIFPAWFIEKARRLALRKNTPTVSDENRGHGTGQRD